MNVNRQYIGARYVPLFFENPRGGNDWLSGYQYDALTIVTYLNQSYTSKKVVPATVGNPKDNPEYWVMTANYNAQVEQYRKDTEKAIGDVNTSEEEYKRDMQNQYNTFVNTANENYNDFTGKTDKKVSDFETEVNDKISKFVESDSNPTVVDNISKMTDHNRVYVLSTNMHIYYWNGAEFADSTLVYGSGANIVQGLGQSAGDVISQKGITDALRKFVNSNGAMIGSASGDYSGEIHTFGELNPAKKYLIWKNAFTTFTDLDVTVTNNNVLYNAPYWIVDAAMWNYYNSATYSAAGGLVVPVLIYFKARLAICKYQSNKLVFEALTARETDVENVEANINNEISVINSSLARKIISNNAWIGSPSGDYSGEIHTFGELNPNRKYLIWKNAFSSFTDLDDSIKNESALYNAAYWVVDAAMWNYYNGLTYKASGGVLIRVIICVNKKLAMCTYQDNTLRLNWLNANNRDLQNINNEISAINDTIADISVNVKGDVNLISPNGTKYMLSVSNTGGLISIPVIPKKSLYIGNSLLLGFGTFGMAASDNQHDYFHYVSTKTGGTTDRVGGSAYEGQTTVEGAQTWLDTTLQSHLSDDIDLVIVQLGDNVNTDQKRAIFPQTCPLILKYIREKCPKARVVWVGSWYSHELKSVYESSCKTTGCEYIDITDITGPSAIGNIVTFPSDQSYTYDVDSFELNEAQKQVTLHFTRNEHKYTATIHYTTYQSNAGISITVNGKERVITETGVASHPGDDAMKKIADRIIKSLGI